jgi:hypothetical protein
VLEVRWTSEQVQPSIAYEPAALLPLHTSVCLCCYRLPGWVGATWGWRALRAVPAQLLLRGWHRSCAAMPERHNHPDVRPEQLW